MTEKQYKYAVRRLRLAIAKNCTEKKYNEFRWKLMRLEKKFQQTVGGFMASKLMLKLIEKKTTAGELVRCTVVLRGAVERDLCWLIFGK